MPSTVKGVIARTKGAPVEIVDVIVADPGPGEAVVKIEACGVCHTDVHYREGGISDEFPFLLGHEAAGVVEAVGEGVLPSALLQVVLQAERDGLAALSEFLFGPRETSDILVRDQVVAVTEPDVDHPGPFRGRPRRRSCRTRRTR